MSSAVPSSARTSMGARSGPGGSKLCGAEDGAQGSCVNLKVDEENCGGCGTVCDGRCVQGSWR